MVHGANCMDKGIIYYRTKLNLSYYQYKHSLDVSLPDE